MTKRNKQFQRGIIKVWRIEDCWFLLILLGTILSKKQQKKCDKKRVGGEEGEIWFWLYGAVLSFEVTRHQTRAVKSCEGMFDRRHPFRRCELPMHIPFGVWVFNERERETLMLQIRPLACWWISASDFSSRFAVYTEWFCLFKRIENGEIASAFILLEFEEFSNPANLARIGPSCIFFSFLEVQTPIYISYIQITKKE